MVSIGHVQHIHEMNQLWIALFGGAATGGLVLAASRRPLLAWLALTPLAVVSLSTGPAATACSGLVAGAVANARAAWNPTLRPLLLLNTSVGGLSWALSFAALSWFVQRTSPAVLVVGLPAASVVATLPARFAGAPRWTSNPLACTQEPWLPVVHTGRLGGDLVTTATLAMPSAALTLLAATAFGLGSSASALLSAAVGALLWTALMLWYGRSSSRSAAQRAADYPTLRVAAVVVDGPNPEDGQVTGLWPMQSPAYRDVEGTLQRYAPHIARAAQANARVAVLPECCVVVDSTNRERWLEGVRGWATAHQITVVAPFVDVDKPLNELAVVDPSGVIADYEKQHPAPRLEPKRTRRMPPGPTRIHADAASLSTVICVDLDYADLVAPVRKSGGILVVPANDWFMGFAELHHRTAVWSAVLTGVSVLRATGHGISSVTDGSGRVLAQCSSEHGPVVMVVDMPCTT